MNVWRPIESAPQDGTRILLYRAGFAESIAVGWCDETWPEWLTHGGTPFPEPTHWMELPAPPAQETA